MPTITLRQMLASIRTDLDSGALASALSGLKTVMRAAPLESEAHFLLGAYFWRRGQYERATAAMKWAALCDPSLPGSWENLAQLGMVAGRSNSHIAGYRRAVAPGADTAELAARIHAPSRTLRILGAWYTNSSPPPSPGKTLPKTATAAHWTAGAQGLLPLAHRKLQVKGSYDGWAQPALIGVIGHHTNARVEWAPIGPDGKALVGGMTANAHAHVRRIKAGNNDAAQPLICHVDQRTIVIGGSENYYHFVVDVLPRLLCVQFANLLEQGWQVAVSNDKSDLMAGAIAFLGISDDRVLWLDPGSDHWFSRAVYITNANIEGYLHPLTSLVLHRMKRRVPTVGIKRLYISRSGIGRRRLLDENELVDGLQARGFVIVRPEEMSLIQQIAAFRSAEVVVGVHGSGLTNVVWADRPQFLLELCGSKPSDEFGVPDLHFEAMAKEMNQCRYQRLRASTLGTERPGDHQSDFRLDRTTVFETIDAALAEI